MLLFFSVILIIAMIVVGTLFSDLRLVIENLEFTNEDKEYVTRYKGEICIYFAGKLKLLRVKIHDSRDKKNEQNNILERKIRKFIEPRDIKRRLGNKKKNLSINKIIKLLKIKKLKLKVILGTEDVVLTSLLIGGISAVVPNLIRDNIENFENDNYKLEFYPVYKNQNYIYLKFSSIISIKLVHIINMLKIMGGKQYERTSYRRLNVNCYGKH